LAKYGEIEEAVGVAIDILKKAKQVHLKLDRDFGLIMNVPVQLIEQVLYLLHHIV